MKRQVGLLPALALGALLTAPGAWAQGRGGLAGTIGKVDTTAGTVEISSRRGGTQSVTVPSTAVILRQTTASAGDLKVGDTITVSGIPRQIDARQIQSGEEIAGLRRTGDSSGAGSRRGAGAGSRTGRRGAEVRVRGTVTATSPALQIRLEDGASVQVTTSSDTTFQRTVRVTLADLKPGEPVMVMTEPGSSTVRAILVGAQQGSRAGLSGEGRGVRRGRAGRVAVEAAPAR